MRLTTMTDYALRLLMYLAHQPGRLCTIAEVAQAYGISQAHLMKITHQLGLAGFVETVRGKGGGMRLAHPPGEIGLGAVVRSMESDFNLTECLGTGNQCTLTGSCRLTGIVNGIDDIVWLREKSPLPIIGDESVQRLPDVRRAWGVYDGINVKLMKCTGMREAYKMITLARALDMKVMLGCMTETSCAISAAAQLSPLVDWADLDGAVLIKNDLFSGATIVDGKVTLPDRPGIGVVPLT